MSTLQEQAENFARACEEFAKTVAHEMGMYKLVVTMETQLQKLKQKRSNGP